MPFSFNVNTRVRSQETEPPRPRGVRLLAGAVLLAAIVALLWMNFDFARYALTGFLWKQVDGTVLSARSTSTPDIRFTAPDGTSHTFHEDYIRMCGRRSLCFIRDLDPGQVVPVVYDPATPQRAYVRDWALTSNCILWFFELSVGLLSGLMFAVAVRRKPLEVSVRFGADDGSAGPLETDQLR